MQVPPARVQWLLVSMPAIFSLSCASNPGMIARKSGVSEALRAVINGADANAVDEHGFTAAWFAVDQNNAEATRQLLAHGANANAKCGGDPLIFDALRHENWEIALLLHKAGADVNARDRQGGTVLGYVMRHGCLENAKCQAVAQAIITGGVDPGTMSATLRGLHNVGEVSWLLERGANAREPELLVNAVARGNEEMVALLLAHGADPDAKGPTGLSARDVALTEYAAAIKNPREIPTVIELRRRVVEIIAKSAAVKPR